MMGPLRGALGPLGVAGGLPPLAAPVPVLGGELLTNPGFEGTYDTEAVGIDIAPGWNLRLLAAPDTAAKETTIVHGGAAAQAFTTATSARGVASADITLTVGTWYDFGCWIKVAAGTQVTELGNFTGRLNMASAVFGTSTTSWQQFRKTARCTLSGAENVVVRNRAPAVNTFYVDDASAVPLALASLLSTRAYATADIDLSVDWSIARGTQAGWCIGLDNPANPQNFIIGYETGAGRVRVDKCVAGVYTNLIDAAISYAAGRIIRGVRVGNSVSCYYNGAQVGSTVTVADAAIVGNKNHGLFSTYAGNTFANYTAV